MRVRLGNPSLFLGRSRSVIALLLATLLSSVILAACAGAAPKEGPAMSVANSAVPAPAAVPAAPSEMQSSNRAPSADNSSPAANASTTDDQIPPASRMVVHNAQLSLQVKDVDLALARLREIAQNDGGYVSTEHASASQSGDQAQTVADVTLRVRADQYNQAIDQIRALAVKVVSVDESSQDVTQQYIDVDANLRNLQASESAILKLMNQTTNINDILTLQRELTNVRGQIERLNAQKQYLERQTSLSTISIHLEPPPVVQSSPLGTFWNPLATVAHGWQDSLSVLRVVADATLYVASAFWWAILLLAAGVYLQRKRRQARPVPVASSTINPS